MNSKTSDNSVLIRLALLLLFCIVGGFFLGVFIQHHWGQPNKEFSGAGFDRPESEARATSAHFGDQISPEDRSPQPEAEPETSASSIDMIRAGSMKGAMPPGQVARPASAGQSLTNLVRKNESLYEKLAISYTRRYPIIREYGRDWYNSPDLRQYNLDYLKNRDPILFAFRVAASPNFAALVKKYGTRPEIHQFIMDAVKDTPGQLADAAMSYLNQDSKASTLVSRFSAALGLPPNLFAAAATGVPAHMPKLQTDQDFRDFVQQGNYDSKQFNSGNSTH